MTETALNISSMTIGLYGIVIAIGILSAIGIALVKTKRLGERTGHVTNMALPVFPFGIGGARRIILSTIVDTIQAM